MHTQNEFIKFNDQSNSPSTFLKMKKKGGKGLKRHEINTWKYCIHIITPRKTRIFGQAETKLRWESTTYYYSSTPCCNLAQDLEETSYAHQFFLAEPVTIITLHNNNYAAKEEECKPSLSLSLSLSLWPPDCMMHLPW